MHKVISEVNTCKRKIFMHNLSAASELSVVDGHPYPQYKFTHRAEEYFTVTK